ncbi:UreD urease accessory protein-domain-containing protein [Phlebopus sp. FC_14]|nr:UreD urease accessory protein-domain-containing protein [Phlebopus sp. FC_14]
MSSTVITSSRRLANEPLAVGQGRITCSLHGTSIVFSELSSTYPLKLLSPRLVDARVAIVYVLNYGGGLVGGDHIKLEANIKADSKLLLLSQGSTKVFKTRPGERASARLRWPVQRDASVTTQIMNFTVAPNGAVFLLPDPVTCFRSASYSQKQRFHLADGASMVLLDWITSGRKSLGEEWAFARYHSVNEVFLDGRRVARDAVLLEDPSSHTEAAVCRPLADRLKPYSCYAMLILLGPLTQAVAAQLNGQYRSISVFKTAAPARMTWAWSAVDEGRAHVVRVAGIETEDVKGWLRESLRGFEDIIGTDAYRKAFL